MESPCVRQAGCHHCTRTSGDGVQSQSQGEMEDGQRSLKSVTVRISHCSSMHNQLILSISQKSIRTQACAQGWSAEEDHVGGTQSQGGATQETHACWREQTEGRAEEGCHRGTNLIEPSYTCYHYTLRFLVCSHVCDAYLIE